MSQPVDGIIRFLYQHLWDNMVIREEWRLPAMNIARKVVANKARYEAVCNTANPHMPWYFVGILHQLECDGSFNEHLHNGDSLAARTVHVPKGRPLCNPPFTWEVSAADALQLEGYCGADMDTWTLPEILYRFEKYNGLGYRSKGIYSPYLWSGTEYYNKGKYAEDGHYDPNLVSQQVGCALILKYVTDRSLGIAV